MAVFAHHYHIGPVEFGELPMPTIDALSDRLGEVLNGGNR